MRPNDTDRNRTRRIPLPVLIVTVVTLSTAALVYTVPHCVPMDRLAAIRPHMSKQDVIRLLGRPQGVGVDAPNHRWLSYWKPGRWCTVDVHLDGDDRVQSYYFEGQERPSVFHDH